MNDADATELWLDARYIKGRIDCEISKNNFETANLLAAMRARIGQLEAQLALAAQPKPQAPPPPRRHTWGIDRTCTRCGTNRMGPYANDDCTIDFQTSNYSAQPHAWAEVNVGSGQLITCAKCGTIYAEKWRGTECHPDKPPLPTGLIGGRHG